MLLKLEALQDPAIHISFSFKDFPPTLSTPLAWSTQASHLVREELEVPETMHSLDKAAGITSLLEEVIFDVKRQEVRCLFADGGIEEWSFYHETGIDAENATCDGQVEGRRLLAVLEGVVRDVRASTEEDERVILEREKERQPVVRLERSKSVSVKSGNGKVSKHKKQRSVFMQFVSSIGSTFANLTSSSSSRLRVSQTVYTNLGQEPLSQPSPPEFPETTAKARALRRAARAALVDAYRRFVLSELTRRLPAFSSRDASGNYAGVYGGGFCVWILHSMRRRAQERVDQLFEEAQAVAPQPTYETPHVSFLEVQQALEQIPGEAQPEQNTDRLESTMAIVSTFDGDGDETATDTDDSSLHTPSSGSHFNHFLVRPPTPASCHSSALSSSNLQDECQQVAQEPDPQFPTTPSISPSPPSSPTSPTFLDSPSSSPSIPPIFPSRPTSSTLSQNLTGAALLEYNDLMDLRERLWQLAMFAESQNQIAAEEVRSRLEVLNVRSRRRAWSAGAFRVGCGGRARSCQASVGFSLQSQYGFAMPCTSSPLARFSWTAEDLENEDETELETAPLRSFVSAAAGFPTFLRPFNLSQEELENIDGIYLGEEEHNRPLVDGEFELYEEFPGPSPLDLRGRRGRRNHHRRRDILELGMSGSMHRLFPVSEELEGEGEEAVDLEFRVALGGGISGYGTVRGRRMERRGRTFMGCDEVPVGCDEDEETLGQSQETLVDEIDGDGLVDPRELDIELGFGFDFHQKGGGRGFLGHADDDLFGQDDDDSDDDSDEDDFKFDLSSQLERPKIRPRVRPSIFMPKDVLGRHKTTPGFLSQPGNFASSSHNLPFYTPLSKSTPSIFPSRSVKMPATHRPVLDVPGTTTPDLSCDPGVADIEIRLVGEHNAGPYPPTHLSNSRRQIQDSTHLWRSVTANADAVKSLPAAPLPLHVPLEIGIHDEGPEEFTLSMDLPRSAAGGGAGNGMNSPHCGGTGKKRIRHAQASPGRSLRLFGHGSFASPC